MTLKLETGMSSYMHSYMGKLKSQSTNGPLHTSASWGPKSLGSEMVDTEPEIKIWIRSLANVRTRKGCLISL